MALKVIFQGLTKETHLKALRAMFSKAADEAIISVAFASDEGVKQLEDDIRPHASVVSAYVGIRNDITSAQALHRLLALGVRLYVVDTGSGSLLFHPKLYYVRHALSAELVVGSANLTAGGLNNNVEASVLAALDLANSDDSALAGDLQSLFNGLPQAHPKNVILIKTAPQIDALLGAGRVSDESVASPPRANAARSGGSDPTPRMNMLVPAIRGGVRPVSNHAPPSLPAGSPSSSIAPNGVASAGVEFELVWASKKLERRDLNIPDGANTAATGSINLDRGQLEGPVDHRHYFRETVFSALNWPATSGQVDLASANFVLVVKGVHHGTFNLTVRHTTSTTSASYLQNNAMTRISWGTAKPLVANEDLLDRYMYLYRDRADPKSFLIQID